ncbi:MAG: RdgB/HAM1 family non-canonical purine NTP pyrophosphatase [Candidatus Obscuribacterales bacterium]|nr:RdgB/HAM1 family non-canonical purine NTP pyrophosphatase [Candidatus Obscuribacterales bacterium]
MKIVLATQNRGKLKELSEMAHGLEGIEFALAPAQFNPEETGSTYLENAVIKAREAAMMTKSIAVADDSGLEVDALGGRPGLHSARYCEGDDGARRHKLLHELNDVPAGARQAAFVCWMAVFDPEKNSTIYTAEGIWAGHIGFEERGNGGFGFDPIFYMNNSDVTAAQLPSQEKNLNSHRGQAWRQVLAFLEKTFIR